METIEKIMKISEWIHTAYKVYTSWERELDVPMF